MSADPVAVAPLAKNAVSANVDASAALGRKRPVLNAGTAWSADLAIAKDGERTGAATRCRAAQTVICYPILLPNLLLGSEPCCLKRRIARNGGRFNQWS
jgi:hypothetical protein